MSRVDLFIIWISEAFVRGAVGSVVVWTESYFTSEKKKCSPAAGNTSTLQLMGPDVQYCIGSDL